MPCTYAHFILGQEEPDAMPNEIAYRISELLGHDHYLIHRALVSVNPELIATAQSWYMPIEALPAVSEEVSKLLLAESLFALRNV